MGKKPNAITLYLTRVRLPTKLPCHMYNLYPTHVCLADAFVEQYLLLKHEIGPRLDLCLRVVVHSIQALLHELKSEPSQL